MTGEPVRQTLAFYATPSHQCSYLADREATTLFADPGFQKNVHLYTILSRNGFRRSGTHIYRPNCEHCQACIPTRVPVNEFKPSRTQRRVWRKNSDLQVIPRESRIREDHYELYRRYINTRHPGGGMQNPTKEQYVEFLTSPWASTVFYEFRLGHELMAVAVTDRLLDGCSAVYTFFEPSHNARSLGVHTILWQLREARRLGLQWLYLGYLIEESTKMSYKRAYRPQEHFRDGRWARAGD